MESILIAVLVLVAIAISVLVLLQHGKGADIGASFGSGASSTVFGSQGSASFLVKLTFILAAVFFVISIALTNLAGRAAKEGLVIIPPANTAAPISVPAATPQKTKANITSESNVPAMPAGPQK
jgi:preprotein translocase subunit SecG